jgi:hypothetical protein
VAVLGAEGSGCAANLHRVHSMHDKSVNAVAKAKQQNLSTSRCGVFLHSYISSRCQVCCQPAHTVSCIREKKKQVYIILIFLVVLLKVEGSVVVTSCDVSLLEANQLLYFTVPLCCF